MSQTWILVYLFVCFASAFDFCFDIYLKGGNNKSLTCQLFQETNFLLVGKPATLQVCFAASE